VNSVIPTHKKGVAFLPKRSCDTSKCEIAVSLRLIRDRVVPISFQVPRKSDLFQKDLYPDTYAGIPSVSSEEWLAGQSKPPKKISMKPGDKPASADAPKTAFVATKSPQQLEKELAVAHARIAELEAELAKLKH